MEVQLREFIEQIKKDGVIAAETEAKSILEKAEADAKKIIADAQAQADKILADAKVENERMVKTSEEAIRQAGRNLLLSFRESVTRECKALIRENVSTAYAPAALANLILQIVAQWAKDPDAQDLYVLLNQADLDAMEALLLAGLKEKMQTGVTLKPNDHFDGGFRIAVNDGGAYYDYSAEAVVEMLSNYLSPKVTALLKEA